MKNKFWILSFFLIFFGILTSCEDKNNEIWIVQLKLNFYADESYIATEEPEIKALISKLDVTFYQSYPEYNVPMFLLYYTLTGDKSKENVIKEFLSTGMFEYNVRELCIDFACGAKLKLKPQADENYLATEDPEIRALISKHKVKFIQTDPNAKNPDLLLYYTLTNEHYKGMTNVIADFLATGKFEGEFFEYGISHTNNITTLLSL